MWYVYILECGDRSLYVGTTTNVVRRVGEHQAGIASAYTHARRPVRVVYQEPHPDRASAQRREAEVKRWPRAVKLAFLRR